MCGIGLQEEVGHTGEHSCMVCSMYRLYSLDNLYSNYVSSEKI